jgi:hypothetical protein
MNTNEENPHSVVIWIRLEKQERKSDGNLSGMPVEIKNCSGRLHLSNGFEASDKLEEFTQKIKELIKREEQEINANSF